jgi:hypothetical protein
MTLDDALREFALDVLPTFLATDGSGDKRIRPNAVSYVLRRAEDLGLVDRVPATEEHIANGAKCEIGDEVWVLADRLKTGDC